MLQQIYPQVSHDFRFELNKDMNFAAAHYIPKESAGRCQNVHGHTYFCNVTVLGDELDEAGFLVNFQAIKKLIHGKFDHETLNDHTTESNSFTSDSASMPSTEAMASLIWDTVQDYLDEVSEAEDRELICAQVFLRETPTSYVVFRPDEELLDGCGGNISQKIGD